MLPARQCLETNRAAAGGIDLRLIMQQQLTVVDCPPQGAFQVGTLRRRLVHARGKELEVGPPQRLGVIHGHVGILQQGVDVGTIVGKDTDADARRRTQLATGNAVRLRQMAQDLAGQRGNLPDVAIGYVRHDDDEFVAAETRHHVAISNAGTQALTDLDQQAVTHGVAKAVVDCLEAIEVDEQYRQAAIVATGQRHRLIEALMETEAVGQTGQRVVVGQMQDLPLGVLALGNVGKAADVVGDPALFVVQG